MCKNLCVLIKNFLLVSLIISYIPSIKIAAQEITVTYQDISPNPFDSLGNQIGLGLLHISGTDSLENNLYNSLRIQPGIHTKFTIYPFKILDEQRKLFKVKELLLVDEKVFKTLSEKLDIQIVVTGNSLSDSEFTLQLYNTVDNKLVLEQTYLNSLTSTALDDAVKLFTERKIPNYLIKSILDLDIKPLEASVKINGINYLDQRIFKLDAGEYDLIIELDGYNTIIEKIKINSEKYIKKRYNLIQKLGSYELNVEPNESYIELFRKDKLISAWIGDTTLYDMPSTEYTIVCKLPGYDTLIKKIEIPAYMRFKDFIPMQRSVRELFKIKDIRSTSKDVKNPFFEMYQDSILIFYDLMGDKNDQFSVKVRLLNLTNPSMKYYPQFFLGDIGTKVFGGSRRQIIWEMRKDYHKGLGEGDIVLELVVE